MRTRVLLLVLGLVGAILAAPAPALAGTTAAGRFVVVTATATDSPAVIASAGVPATSVSAQYSRVLSGFAAQLTSTQVSKLASDSRVVSVTPDAIAQIATRHPAGYYGELTTMGVRSPGGNWGLGRITQREPLPPGDWFDYYFDADGEGVTAFLLDSGAAGTVGSIGSSHDFVDDDADASDCNGHGTWTSSLADSDPWGVAELATVVPVRVFDCDGVGLMSDLIAGLDWTVAQRSGPSVVNIGGGGVAFPLLDQAVNRTVALGIPVVVAAGNDGDDACQHSPARAGSAITVAASTKDDRRADFSNYGPCVDLVAPGADLESRWNTSPGYKTASGTSGAAALVTGALARRIEYHGSETPAQLVQWLTSNATGGRLSSLSGTPDRLLYLSPPVMSTPPRNVIYNFDSANASVEATWDAPSNPGSVPVDSYFLCAILERAESGGSGYPTWDCVHAGPSARSLKLDNLSRGASGEIVLSLYTKAGTVQAPSKSVWVTPLAPSSIVATKNDAAATATLTWDEPSLDYQGITGYKVSRNGTDNRGNGAWSTTLPATARSQTFNWLNGATNYDLTVQAVNAGGVGLGATTKVTMGTTPPAVPTKVTASKSEAASSATLVWEPPAATGGAAITGYKLSRDGTDNRGNGAWSTTLPATARSQTFNWLNGASTYNLTVQAITSAGTGIASTSKITMGTTIPAVPTKVTTAKSESASTATLSWSPPAATGGAAITGYKVSRDGTDNRGNGAWTTTLPATGRSQTFNWLNGASTYNLTVQAITSAGTGIASTSRITMGTTIPAVPASLSVANDVVGGRATVTWTAPSATGGSALTGYRLVRDGTDSKGVGPKTLTVSATTRSQTFDNLRIGVAYTVTVQATNAAGAGPARSVTTTLRQ